MKIKKYIPVLIYLLLFLACLAIVFLAGRLARPSREKGEETTSVFGESETESAGLGKEEEELVPEETKETGQAGIPYEKPRGRRPCPDGLEEEEPEETEEPYVPPAVMLASDVHYISGATHDEGTAFEQMVASDDGKLNGYSDILVDTLVEEALARRPSALVLTGDITHNGERENHLGLAEKLRRVTEAGICVLVIPGNHDVNNHNAATYFGSQRAEAQYLETGQDFLDVYHEFGYDQALSRDPASLSYVYALDDTHWMLMLDTCQYEDYNHVNGRLKGETMEWVEAWLVQAREQGVEILPAGHHNLLSESRLYTVECTMENHDDVVELFERYELPLYVSGHLHAQRIKKHKTEPGVCDSAYGITEIVLPPYSIAPCQYGWLAWGEEGGMDFKTEKADVASYALSRESADENLLRFDEYGPEFTKTVVREQAKKTIGAIPENLKEEMADLYSQIYFDYCAGNRMGWDGVRATRAYQLWDRVAPDSQYVKDMGQMIEDVKQDLHSWSRQGEEPWD